MNKHIWRQLLLATVILGGTTVATMVQSPSQVARADVAPTNNAIKETGVWGTAPWEYDSSTGTLTIHSGQIPATYKPIDGEPTSPKNFDNNVKHLVFAGEVKMPKSADSLFSDAINLETVTTTGIGHVDASETQDMNSMFGNCGNLKMVDFSAWTFGKAVTVENMFVRNSSLQEVLGWNKITFAPLSSTGAWATFAGTPFYNATLDNGVWHWRDNTTGPDPQTPPTQRKWGSANIDFDPTTGILTVTSSGELPAFDGENNLGWGWPGDGTSSQAGRGIDKASVKEIHIDHKVSLEENATKAFADFPNLTTITGLNNVDTSQVSTMAGLFQYDGSLQSVAGLENWDVSHVVDMSAAFAKTHALNNVNLSQWNVHAVTDMSNMFWEYATTIPGRAWLDTSDPNQTSGGVVDISGKFAQTTGQVEDMSYMFADTVYQGSTKPELRGLYNIIGLKDLDTHSLVNMAYMFNGSSLLRNIDVSQFDTSLVRNYNNAFNFTSKNHSLDLSKVDTSGKSQTNWLANIGYADDTVAQVKEGSYDVKYGLDTLKLGSKTVLTSQAGLVDPVVGNPTFDANGKKVTRANWLNLGTGAELTAKQLMDGQPHPGTWQWNTRTLSQISVKDSTLMVGPKTQWQPADNFVSVTEVDGHAVTFDSQRVNVSGHVDVTKAGIYPVTYSYTDSQGNTVSQTAHVTVLASPTAIKVHNSQLTAGHKATWSAKDNFDSAEDDQGRPLPLDQIQVTGKVDASRVGTYPITYTYTDSLGNTVSQTAQVAVVPSSTAISVHNSQLIAGHKATWSAKDNFDRAIDSQGKLLAFDQIHVSGTVNPKVVGVYQVTYSFVDQSGWIVASQAVVKVVAEPTTPSTPKTPTTPATPTTPSKPTTPMTSAATASSLSLVTGTDQQVYLPKTSRVERNRDLNEGSLLTILMLSLSSFLVTNKKQKSHRGKK
ncbi:bacterial Ig-like domain-containing protein [uncultured Fructobacillus sp.]|uniref:bacterial Ig-like domain-containing protein n=1 Tax=uncultured Fructobacillus sp. TaxID=591942 RepID=UPI002597629B|nr:bacterial Ig-like domain-containing protein [uncultured Fructobacillus sp.]